MSMLNAHDLMWMQDTVREIIREWDTTIKIYSRLPLEEQPNYSQYMHEFTGDSYCSMIIIDAERKDIVNNMTNDPDIYEMDYGKQNDGTLLFAIPNVFNGEQYKPSLHDLVVIPDDDNVYCIRNMKDRIGETLVTLLRFTGNTPKIIMEYEDKIDEFTGENILKHIIIRDYKWSGVDG